MMTQISTHDLTTIEGIVAAFGGEGNLPGGWVTFQDDRPLYKGLLRVRHPSLSVFNIDVVCMAALQEMLASDEINHMLMNHDLPGFYLDIAWNDPDRQWDESMEPTFHAAVLSAWRAYKSVDS